VRPLIRVVSAAESAARDSAAITSGIPSRALMQRAGAAAASEIALRYRDRLSAGVLVVAGPGNNGGDGWVVARALHDAGARVRVVEPVEAKTPDARAERALALEADVAMSNDASSIDRGEAFIVDALLGTGAGGAPRGEIASAIDAIVAMRARGAIVVSIDIPSGLDATSGAAPGAVVHADLTLTFGSLKRGLLVTRGACGSIAVLDIGLGRYAQLDDGAPSLIDERWVADQVPPIAASAHKGDRKKVVIVGGAQGMAGAAVLAARAALRSGVGMVKLVVASESLATVQQQEPVALAAAWPDDEASVEREIATWADSIVIGPGLGRSDESRAVLLRVLRNTRAPVVLDADAITMFEGRGAELAELLSSRAAEQPSSRAAESPSSRVAEQPSSRAALLTPHPVEFSRISSRSVKEVLDERFDIGSSAARQLGAAVLLKGTPTVVSDGRGNRFVSAAGTPALATGGSGDVLSGIAGTMIAQIGDPLIAGGVAAWIHGRAAERVPQMSGGGGRGIALEDVIAELRDSWTFDERPTRYPVLVELPHVGDER
jgi:NAD(P)H-hydrate epimerase